MTHNVETRTRARAGARTLRGISLSVVLAVVALALVACTPSSTQAPVDSGAATSSPSTPTTMPADATASPSAEPTPAPKPVAPAETAVPTVDQVYEDLVTTAEYRSWRTAPGFSKRRAGSGPHGPQVQVFVNDRVSDALGTPGLRSLPVGSMLMKDGYDASGAHVKVAFMQKTDRGWYFAEWDGDGKVIAAGLKKPLCAGCHALGVDSVRSFKLR